MTNVARHWPVSKKFPASDFLVLGAAEAADFAAIAARIIPTTDTPGASEAGVIHFFDNAFAGAMRDDLEAARSGLAEFNLALAVAGHDGRFGQLSADEQDNFLRAHETSAFFTLVREMTVFGFFAMSSYGGNKDNVGWKHLARRFDRETITDFTERTAHVGLPASGSDNPG